MSRALRATRRTIRRATRRAGRAGGPHGGNGTSSLRTGLTTIRRRLTRIGSRCRQVLTRCTGCGHHASRRGARVNTFAGTRLLAKLLADVSGVRGTVTTPTNSSCGANISLILHRFVSTLGGLNLRRVRTRGTPFSPGIRGTIVQRSTSNIRPRAIATIFRGNCGVNSQILHPTVIGMTGWVGTGGKFPF